MWEMIRHAWEGWINMHLYGKYMVLVLLVLGYLWISQEDYATEQPKKVLRYVTVTVPLCICPVTAAVFMGYQTRFYDYPWIWSLVPVTAFIAMGATLLLVRMQEGPRLPKTWQQALFAAALIMLIWLSGGLGSRERSLAQEKSDYQRAEAILEHLETENRELCIWGPTMVQEYVRMIDSRIGVPYGRNMWDESLNAYFYDTYDEDSIRLYEIMDRAQNKARFTDMDGLRLAKERGVTHLILPEYVLYEDVERIARELGSEIQQLQGYFVVAVQ